jgi:tetrapyrrole methylase family protein/MazG family protein
VSEPDLIVAGLGPAGLDRLPGSTMGVLIVPGTTVIARTRHHPSTAELGELRDVVFCDDLYEQGAGLDEVYHLIADRVVTAAQAGPTAYVVPGSAVVGERAVRMVRTRAEDAGLTMLVIPGESFLDLLFERTGLDPIGRATLILDGRDLPDPLLLQAATVITQVDRPVVLADVATELGKVLPDDTPVTYLDSLGTAEEAVLTVPLSRLARLVPGPRTSLYLDPPPAGWHGLVTTVRRLRRECPWDREQTHHSLVRHLLEEAYETVDTLLALPEDAPAGEADFGVYAEVEEELGDLLLQVVLHGTLAREAGAFDVEEVAEGIRRKLVHRHPHVFGDVVADDSATVKANWEDIKAGEKRRASLMDDVPEAFPGLARADKLQRRAATVGFDWDEAAPVRDKVREEIDELRGALGDDAATQAELGDLLFAVVNLARHLDVDPELALRQANARFATRFRAMEEAAAAAGSSLGNLPAERLEELWEGAKAAEGEDRG